MTKIIIAQSKIDCEHLLGQFLDETHFDTVINEDTDCYLHSEDESNIAFKFRKNYFSKQEQEDNFCCEGSDYSSNRCTDNGSDSQVDDV